MKHSYTQPLFISIKILASQENVTSKEQESHAQKVVPPKAPRSAFMCFTDAKKKETLAGRNDVKENDDSILKLVAEQWRGLSSRDRAHWDEEARNDKVRYVLVCYIQTTQNTNSYCTTYYNRFVREKAAYKGPWAVPKRRAKKHPLAPKRPMSAFLKFSQKRRSVVKVANPDMSNTDVSRLLGEMWRNASSDDRGPYVEQEERERAAYKAEIKKWRAEQAKVDSLSRTSHEEVGRGTMIADKPPPQQQSTNAFPDFFSGSGGFEPLNVHSTHATARSDQRMYRPVSKSGTTQHERTDMRMAGSSFTIPFRHGGSYPYRAAGEGTGTSSHVPTQHPHRGDNSPPIASQHPMHADFVPSAPGPIRYRPQGQAQGELQPAEQATNGYYQYGGEEGQHFHGPTRSKYFSDETTQQQQYGFYHSYP
jgi:hypothetical protein